MSQVYFSATVKEDGSLLLPAFSVQGLGFVPGDTVRLSMPVERPNCGFGCFTDELFLGRCCSDSLCSGYTSDGEDINIPVRLFALADVPVGTEITLFAGDKALVMVAGTEDCSYLPDAIGELLKDLGIAPGITAPVGKDF